MTWIRLSARYFVAASFAGSLLFSSCSKNEQIPKDTTPPVIAVKKSEVDVSGGKTLLLGDSQMFLWDDLVASWTDDMSQTCQAKVQQDDQGVASGTTIDKAGTLQLTVTDEAWWSKSASIKLLVRENYGQPTITLIAPSVNIFGWGKVEIKGDSLYIDERLVAKWQANDVPVSKVTLTFNGAEIGSGTMLNEAGTLTLTVAGKQGKTSSAEIELTNDTIYGLESLKNSSLQVDKETDLLKWITFADGINLIKTEIQIDEQKTIIEDPHHYTPEYPWECSIIFTIEKKDNTTEEIIVDKLTIKPLDHKTLSITSLKPADILPIIWQIEWWDGYSPIEHLRVAESTKMRDMMRKYWAWNHTSEQYQQLMSRLHTGMTWENPIWYNNYEKLWWDFIHNPSNHAHNERNILNTIINHANYEIAGDNERDKTLNQLAKNNPNNIHIFWNSIYVEVNTNETLKNEWENLKEASKLPNFIFFIAWSNIDTKNWIIKNKIFHEDIDPDPSCIYWLPSFANWQNDTKADKHLILTIWTNSKGNSDISNKSIGGNFPVWFHPNILFSGRAFPYTELQYWHIRTQVWDYETSLPNYFNVAMTDLCFQMFAEVENVDQLLDMIRTTSLTDYISLDWETQALHLINPAWFIQKYLMPKELPATISWSKTAALDKGYYKGIIFDIPGAEVNIGGEWIAFNTQNKDLIKAQNPFTLEWRLNGNLLRKMGYRSGDTVKGKLLVVDDQFNGLNIAKEVNFNMTP